MWNSSGNNLPGSLADGIQAERLGWTRSHELCGRQVGAAFAITALSDPRRNFMMYFCLRKVFAGASKATGLRREAEHGGMQPLESDEQRSRQRLTKTIRLAGPGAAR